MLIIQLALLFLLDNLSQIPFSCKWFLHSNNGLINQRGMLK